MSQEEKWKLYAKCQEGTRKDVEKAFDMLKSRFEILCGPSSNWQTGGTVKNIILTCIILLNMIIKDKWDMYNGNVDVDYNDISEEISNIDVSCDVHPKFVAYL